MKDNKLNSKLIGRGLVVALLLACFAGATFAGVGTSTTTIVSTFFTNIKTILTTISVVVITVAIIFAGYQIAFNNKRVNDVMPVFIGGLVVGLGTALATFFVTGTA
jgi:type IV secretion system protein VirB2